MDEFTAKMHETMTLTPELEHEHKVRTALIALSLPSRVKRLGRELILKQYGLTEEDIKR